MLSVNSCDDVKDPRREQRPFRSSDRERLLRQRIRFVIRGHLNGMRWTALRDSDAERESIGVEELAGAIGPIVESDDGERFRGAAERGGVRSVHHLCRHQERHDAAGSGQRERPLEKNNREVGLMKCRVAARGCAKEAISIGVHPLCAGIDALIADPRRISDNDIEPAAGHHVREMDVVGEKIELAIFGLPEELPQLDDARVQVAAAADIQRTHATK